MTPLERAEAAIAPLFMEDLPDPVAIARAVVQAIREPNPVQVKAGWAEASDGADPVEIYTAMIDALLCAS